MSQSPKLRGLGRGLSALLGDEEVAATVTAPPSAPEPPAPEPANSAPSSRPPLTLPISHLKPGKMQPRTTFEDIEVLVELVKEFGLLQPILVRPVAGTPDTYEIVAGERRWRAAQKAQLHDVPVVIRTMGDQDALQLGLIENLQRADLTAIDEAQAYRRLSAGLRPEPRRHRPDGGQEPAARRQHGAPARTAGSGPGYGPRRPAFGRPGAGADRRARSPRHGATRSRREAHGARARTSGRRPSSARPKAPRPSRKRRRAPTRARWRSASRTRWASRPSSSCAGWASRACSPWRSATSTSSTRVVDRLTRR